MIGDRLLLHCHGASSHTESSPRPTLGHRPLAFISASRLARLASLVGATDKTSRHLTYATLDHSCPIEEETLRNYKAEHYYPVQIGDVFQHRYSVIGKLGYGTASTVWLCHDLSKESQYVALEVHTNRSRVHRELPVYSHINSLRPQHEGQNHIRKLLDSFEVSGTHGKHTCLYQEALGMSLEELKDLVPSGMFAADLIRQSLRDILRGLHFLDKEARIIHTGTAWLLLRSDRV